MRGAARLAGRAPRLQSATLVDVTELAPDAALLLHVALAHARVLPRVEAVDGHERAVVRRRKEVVPSIGGERRHRPRRRRVDAQLERRRRAHARVVTLL